MKTLIFAIVLSIIGLIETGFNLYFLVQYINGGQLKMVKKFHGDFPSDASTKAWLLKMITMLIMGILALITVGFIMNGGYAPARFMLIVFSAGMATIGLIQTIAYGRKHPPAVGSLMIGLLFMALSVFLY